jgi:hypothetical protein
MSQLSGRVLAWHVKDLCSTPIPTPPKNLKQTPKQKVPHGIKKVYNLINLGKKYRNSLQRM